VVLKPLNDKKGKEEKKPRARGQIDIVFLGKTRRGFLEKRGNAKNSNFENPTSIVHVEHGVRWGGEREGERNLPPGPGF